jgi:hypothetical protein
MNNIRFGSRSATQGIMEISYNPFFDVEPPAPHPWRRIELTDEIRQQDAAKQAAQAASLRVTWTPRLSEPKEPPRAVLSLPSEAQPPVEEKKKRRRKLSSKQTLARLRKRRSKLREERKKNQQCVACGVKLTTKLTRCSKCQEKHKRNNKRSYKNAQARRKEAAAANPIEGEQ